MCMYMDFNFVKRVLRNEVTIRFLYHTFKHAISLKKILICVCVHMCRSLFAGRGQRTALRSKFSPATLWDLCASVSTH